jgi:hypothetical protein
MSKARKPNKIVVDGVTSRLLIPHRGSDIAVLIDTAVIPIVRLCTWSIGTSRSGYQFVESSAWCPGVGQFNIRLARLLLDAPDNLMVDHRNRDPLDMRLENLRLVPRMGNAQNRGPARTNQSGERGLTLVGGKFRVRVSVNGKIHNLGTFIDKEQGIATATRFRLQHMPYTMEEP